MQDGERRAAPERSGFLHGTRSGEAGERDRVLGLFRRGRIDETTLDQQLDMIDAEAAGLQAEIEMAARALSAGDRTAQFHSAEALLETLQVKAGRAHLRWNMISL